MNYTNPRIQSNQIAGNPWRPLRIRSGSSDTNPEIECFSPGSFMGNGGDLYTVWVDFVYGDDNDANGYAAGTGHLELTSVHPFHTFASAWNAVVSAANGNSNVRYVIRLKNAVGGYLLPVGSPAITQLPQFPNVVVKGDGIDVTVFTQSDDNLTFKLDNTALAGPIFLQFEDMTLYHLTLRAEAPGGRDAVGRAIAQGLTVRGNGTTGIISDISIYAGDGGKGSDITDGGQASGGANGGSITNAVVEGFVAVQGFANLSIYAGKGGDGGDAYLFMTGEYNDQETYGNPGNGGTPGWINNVLVKNMTSWSVVNDPYMPCPGGWNVIAQQGDIGSGGVDKGGGSDGNKNSSDSSTIPGSTPQYVLFFSCAILNFQSYPNSSPADGRATIGMYDCSIGFYNNATRELCVYAGELVGGILHTAVTLNASGTPIITTSIPVSGLMIA